MNRIPLLALTSCVLLAVLFAGCAPNVGTPTAGPTIAAQPTTAAATPISPTGTAVPANTAVPTSAAATPSSAPTASTPRIAVQLPDNSVQLVDASGNKTPMAKLDGQVDLAAVLLAQNTVGSAIYLPMAGLTPGVMRIDVGGAHKLNWIKGPVNGLAVSATRLAWGTSDLASNPATSQILISGLDGSQQKTILQETYTGIPQALRPLRWSQDGERLYFSKEPSGLGGYILFGGITNLWSYDLRDGKTTEVAHEPAKNAAICIDDLAPNEQIIVDHCSVKNIQVTTLADKKTTVINPPSNVGPIGVAGGARFSPDGTVVAYALARREPDNEQGWVAITNGFSGDSKLIATSPAKDYFSVAAWLDAETIVLQSGLQTPGVWIVRNDGSGLKRLTDGTFVGIAAGAAGSLTPVATIRTNIIGKVTKALEPMPGARVELRQADKVVAQAFAGADWSYALTNPPDGDYSLVVVWPDGKAQAGLPAHIPQGGAGEFVVSLDQNIQLIEPAINAELDAPPTLRWASVPGAHGYQAIVVDAGTTELVMRQADMTETSLKVTPEIKMGRTYNWSVDVTDATGKRIGWLTSRFTLKASSSGNAGATPAVSETDSLPPSCRSRNPQVKVYSNRQDGYCFLYPARFQVGDPSNGQPNIVGPALDNGPDSMRASLTVEVKPAAAGSDLAKLVDAFLAELPKVTPAVTHQPSNLGLGGERAQVLENVPARLSSHNLMVLHNGKLYNLWFQPMEVAEAQSDVDELFQTVTGSFTFVP